MMTQDTNGYEKSYLNNTDKTWKLKDIREEKNKNYILELHSFSIFRTF